MIKPSIQHISIAAVLATLAIVAAGGFYVSKRPPAKDVAGVVATPASAKAKQRATLTVFAITPESHSWAVQLSVNGSVAAWQEAVVGSELSGLRLDEVLVNVGDVVRRGQVLARFSTDRVAADLAQQEAALEEAVAALAEAKANADRARALSASGAMSKQQTSQTLTIERSAAARVQSAQARIGIERLRMKQTLITAPDDGIISVRNATLGTVVQQGMELFKLVRKGRLEWRAEVPASELLKIKRGQTVRLRSPNGSEVVGSVRTIAPLADVNSRNTLVYVDLPPTDQMHGGMFASGQFDLGHTTALSVPESAVVTRDGYDYVYQILADNKIKQIKVILGRRAGARIEILDGLPATAKLVGQGGGFLVNGDLVNLVAAAETTQVK